MTNRPLSTQGWNRYAYTENNPLNATDPTGFNWVKDYIEAHGSCIICSGGDETLYDIYGKYSDGTTKILFAGVSGEQVSNAVAGIGASLQTADEAFNPGNNSWVGKESPLGAWRQFSPAGADRGEHEQSKPDNKTDFSFYLALKPVKAGFDHASIMITYDDIAKGQCICEDTTATHTGSQAAAALSQANLIRSPLDILNKDIVEQQQIGNWHALGVPSGKTSLEFYNNLRSAADAYPGNLRYGPFPGTEQSLGIPVFNSNSFAAGVVKQAGGNIPNTVTSDRLPGLETPIFIKGGASVPQ